MPRLSIPQQEHHKNAHPIPSIAQIMDKLKGSKWFSKLDI
jgi:hypothetical protein